MSAVKEILSGKLVRFALLESVDNNILKSAVKYADGLKDLQLILKIM